MSVTNAKLFIPPTQHTVHVSYSKLTLLSVNKMFSNNDQDTRLYDRTDACSYRAFKQYATKLISTVSAVKLYMILPFPHFFTNLTS